jgi:hypothetical protein
MSAIYKAVWFIRQHNNVVLNSEPFSRLLGLHTYTTDRSVIVKIPQTHPTSTRQGNRQAIDGYLVIWHCLATEVQRQRPATMRQWNTMGCCIADVKMLRFLLPVHLNGPLRNCELRNCSCKCDSPPSGPPRGRSHPNTALSRSHFLTHVHCWMESRRPFAHTPRHLSLFTTFWSKAVL